MSANPKSQREPAANPWIDWSAIADPLGGQLTRTRILQGSARVFAKKSMAEATVEDILQAAGVSRRTFYQFFKNKEETLDALYEVATDMLVTACRKAADSVDAPQEKFERAIEVFLSLQKAQGPLVSRIQAEAIRPDSRLAPRRAETMDRLVEIFDANIRALQDRALDPYVFRTLLIAIEGLSIHMGQAGELSDEAIGRAKAVLLSMINRTLAPPGARLPKTPELEREP
ncbi:MAG: TetR/AcrR family transcriptional regulator [Deltaproteobacteria bacterium]|nr:TetR/AcrR family transcriptional regulator [Deltaproteobacteria bacterium]MCB9487356.1 TetR/AcrR family transcriptional regulator [Deltaproteobacteria bacterium]